MFALHTCVENVRYTLPPCHKICRRQKTYCVNRVSLCVVLLVRTYFEVYCLHESTNHVNLSELVKNHPRGPGDAATRNDAVWIFLGQ